MTLQIMLVLIVTSWLVLLFYGLSRGLSRARLPAAAKVLRVLALLFAVPSLIGNLLLLNDMLERGGAGLTWIFGLIVGLPLGLYGYWQCRRLK